MYRDDLEALRERSRDLDRELATARANRHAVAPPPFRPVRNHPPGSLGGLIAFLLLSLWVLVCGITNRDHRAEIYRSYRAQQALMSRHALSPEWGDSGTVSAHIVGKGTQCRITLSPPCRALVTCGGKILYRGSGACRPQGFVDRGDSWLDGTPQFEIDLAAKRATVRDVACHRPPGSDYYPTQNQVDMEIP